MGIKIAPLFFILLGILMRLLPHQPNFTPIAAIALFSASYLPKKYAFILPISALFISDIFIGFYGITMVAVYGSFLLTGFIGLMIKRNKNIYTIIIASLSSSILFYLITNFAVWADPASSYSKDLAGLLNSYILALPFFKNTLTGDLFFTGVFFISYDLILKTSKNLLSKKLFQEIF